jgi:hypothetical protein
MVNLTTKTLQIFLLNALFVVQVWQMAGLWIEVNHAVIITNSAIDAKFSLLQNLSQEHVQHMAVVLWSLWKHRNIKL